jgi:hypothetical protein
MRQDLNRYHRQGRYGEERIQPGKACFCKQRMCAPIRGQSVPVDVRHDEAAQQKKEINGKVGSADKRKDLSQSRLRKKKDVEMIQHHHKRGDATQAIKTRNPRRVTHQKLRTSYVATSPYELTAIKTISAR